MGEADTPLIVVSGLPRSGTSLMMQILEAGGIPAFTDGLRTPDQDNPHGYFEWEAIKKIGQDHRILDDVIDSGKAIKVISTLLPKLPKAHRYKIIFMERDITEVIQSQQKMLAARGEQKQDENLTATAKRLKAHNDQIIAWMQASPHIDALMVNHRKLIQNPKSRISQIIAFLGSENFPSADAMAAAVDPGLYRNRRNKGLLSRLSSLLHQETSRS